MNIKYNIMKKRMQISGVSATSVTIIESIVEKINNPEFIENHKKYQKNFIRDRIFTFQFTMLFLFNILKEGVQGELDAFFGRIEKSDTKIHKVTASAFTQARAKLLHSAFIELDTLQCDIFYTQTKFVTWHGFRLIAIDGSTVVVPTTDATKKFFGVQSLKKDGAAIVLARISEAFDPLNHITLDAIIKPYCVDEGTMMIEHVKRMQKGDLGIFDRNYPSFWAYKLLHTREIDFCFRIQAKGRGKVIEEFVESGEKDKIVEIDCNSKSSKDRCLKLNLDTESVKCRLIRIDLKAGETEVLVVSLFDQEKFPYEYFEELYHLRWPVEEDYKLLKTRLEIENFSGKSIEAIHQDFFAKIFMANLTSILAFDAIEEIEKKTEHRKFDYKINWSNAISNMKITGALLFIRENFKLLLSNLNLLFQVSPVPIVLDRSFPRNFSKHKRRFSMCYK